MTKTWCIVLAAVLGLTTSAALHAAPPPEFLNLPPTDIKPQPVQLDTKAPPPPAPLAPDAACAPANPCCKPAACSLCGSCSLCAAHLNHLLTGCRHEHSGLDRLRAWLLFRPCQCTPLECCYCLRPYPDNYLYFLYPGCQDHDCGGCCNGRAACGCKTCGK
jgi:hypothetical protein